MSRSTAVLNFRTPLCPLGENALGLLQFGGGPADAPTSANPISARVETIKRTPLPDFHRYFRFDARYTAGLRHSSSLSRFVIPAYCEEDGSLEDHERKTGRVPGRPAEFSRGGLRAGSRHRFVQDQEGVKRIDLRRGTAVELALITHGMTHSRGEIPREIDQPGMGRKARTPRGTPGCPVPILPGRNPVVDLLRAAVGGACLASMVLRTTDSIIDGENVPVVAPFRTIISGFLSVPRDDQQPTLSAPWILEYRPRLACICCYSPR